MSSDRETQGRGVLFRVLLLYGAYSLCHNLGFLLGYHLLSPGTMKGAHPACMIASRVAGFTNKAGPGAFLGISPPKVTPGGKQACSN